MKKLFICLMVVTLLVGCTKEEETVEYNSSIRIHYEGVDISPGQKFNPDDIKKTPSVYSTKSCAFVGQDKIYDYGNVEITTNVRKGYELIYSVSILDESITNDEEIKIEDEISKIEEVYGDKYKIDVEDFYYTVSDDVVEIVFIEEEGVVSNIEYSLIIDK